MLDVAAAHSALVLGLIQQRLPQCTAIAFGSRISGWPFGGGAKPYSDLDIALWGVGPGDDAALAHLRADFEDSRLPWRVDISVAQDLPVALRTLVRTRGVLLQGARLEEFNATKAQHQVAART